MPFCPFCRHPLAFVEKVCPQCRQDVPKPGGPKPEGASPVPPAVGPTNTAPRKALTPNPENNPPVISLEDRLSGMLGDDPPLERLEPPKSSEGHPEPAPEAAKPPVETPTSVPAGKTVARKAIVLEEPPTSPTPTAPPAASGPPNKTTPRKAISLDSEPLAVQPLVNERIKALFEENKPNAEPTPQAPSKPMEEPKEPERSPTPEPAHRFAGLRNPDSPKAKPAKPPGSEGLPYISISRPLVPRGPEAPSKIPHIRKFQLVVEDKFGTTLYTFKLREGKNRVGVYSTDFGTPEVDFTSLDNDHVISRRQAEIIIDRGKISVHDLGSRNGTIIRDEKYRGGPTLSIDEGEQLIFANQICKIVMLL